MKKTTYTFAMPFLCLLLFSSLPAMATQAGQQGQQILPPAAAAPPTDQSPTYDQTVSWITDAISKAGSPDITTTNAVETLTQTVKGSIQFDSCNSFTIVISWTNLGTYTPEYARFANSPTSEGSMTATFKFDLRHVAFFHYKQSVSIAALDGIGHWHFHSQEDGSPALDREGSLNQSTINNRKEFEESGGALIIMDSQTLNPGIRIGYARPGTEDMPPHLVAAFQHLVSICKEHPEQAPKPMF